MRTFKEILEEKRVDETKSLDEGFDVIFDFLLSIPSKDYEKYIIMLVDNKEEKELQEIKKSLDSLKNKSLHTKIAYSIVTNRLKDLK
jgi:cellulose synthase/poly-beta-1,6-N-acetylglucosamine synthase-like glycosyltransferase